MVHSMKNADSEYDKIMSELERRKMKQRKDVDEFKVVEGVIDIPTLKTLYRLFNRGTLRALHGVVSTGKEANVYRGEDENGKAVAVKIYRVSTAETDFMMEYIMGDPRFKRVKRRSRSLIPLWALKEYKNLTRYSEAGVRVPKPIDIERNVLVMEYIGDTDSFVPAPLLKDVELESPIDVFDEIISMIELGYKEANLVHADLSEFNILWWDKPVIIDVSQAVLNKHNYAIKYLRRDIHNISNYFRRLGVQSEDPEEIVRYILSSGET
ncbi:MAG: RIO-type serine/threonine-protein kinase Rio1 [Candidatus Thorarchaeota archaeon]|nr:MAG: RIO-type serine/threonine-protein kinase Rio1 [Candidatus Thorarchaeota archaeon]